MCEIEKDKLVDKVVFTATYTGVQHREKMRLDVIKIAHGVRTVLGSHVVIPPDGCE